jgi:hypothetical protein
VSIASLIATAISSLTVLVAVIFGLLTLRQWRRTRYLTAAVELVHAMQTPEFTRSIARVVELPIAAEPQAIMGERALSDAVFAVCHTFESLGVLVFHRLLPLHLVDHLIGGYARASWKRLHPYVTQRRETMGAMFGEWYEWLVMRMEESPAPGKSIGANVAHWKWRA